MKYGKTKKSGILVFILVLSLVFTQAVPAFAAEPEETTAVEKPVYNYVSLGASNANGYALYNYLGPEVYERPGLAVFKEHIAIDQIVDGAYPQLVRDWLQEELGDDVTVKLNQMAASGMRTHELRMLLDDTYYGDRFTEWRFFSQNKKYDGQLWFGDKNELAGLRALYKEYISGADLITIDMGMNDLSTYPLLGLLSPELYEDAIYGFSYKPKPEFNDLIYTLTPAEAKTVNALKNSIRRIANIVVRDDDTKATLDTVNSITDTLTYALVSFIRNYDICMDLIRELNPDAKIIVMGVQNPVGELKIRLGNYTLPLGDILAVGVDAANIYLAEKSANEGDFVYTNCGVGSHADTITSDVRAYNGNPQYSDEGGSLSKDFALMIDVIELTLYPATRVIEYMFMNKENALKKDTILGVGPIKLAYYKTILGKSEDPLSAFFYWIDGGDRYDGKHLTKYGFLSPIKIDGQSPRDLVKTEEYNDIYEAGYRAAWNVLGWISKVALDSETLNIGSLDGLDLGAVDAELMSDVTAAMDREMEKAIKAALRGKTYDYGNFTEKDAKALLGDGVKLAYATFSIKANWGNSLALHPNRHGHEQLAAAIESAYGKFDNGGYTKEDLEAGVKVRIDEKKTILDESVNETITNIVTDKIPASILKIIVKIAPGVEAKSADTGLFKLLSAVLKVISNHSGIV